MARYRLDRLLSSESRHFNGNVFDVSVEEPDYLRLDRLLREAVMRCLAVPKSLSRTAEDAGTGSSNASHAGHVRGPCSGRSAAPRWPKTRAGHARRVVWRCICMRASSCLWVAGASIELRLSCTWSGGACAWLMVTVVPEKQIHRYSVLSTWHINNRKSSDLVYKKCMDVCVHGVVCICSYLWLAAAHDLAHILLL